MGKIINLISDLAIKAGVNIASPEFMALKTSLEGVAVEIPDDIATGINAGLMNEDAALNNPALLKKTRGEAFSTSEKFLFDAIADLDEDLQNEIKTKPVFEQKAQALKGVIAKLKEAKADTKSAPEKAALQAKIDELHGQIKTANESKTKEISDLTLKFENQELDYTLKGLLTGRPYKLSGKTPEENTFAVETAANKVRMDLQSKGYKLVRENGNLTLKTLDDQKPFDVNHNPVDFQKFIDGAISPLLSPVDPGKPNPPPPGAGGNGAPGNQNVSAVQQLAELSKSFQ